MNRCNSIINISISKNKFCFFILFTLVLFNFNLSVRISAAEEQIDGVEKFKKAIVHLECAADSKSYEEQNLKEKELNKKFNEGKLTKDELSKELMKLSRDFRVQGTAIFLQDDNKRYLVTARHVLYDAKAGVGGVTGPGARSIDPIYYMVYRVPSLEDYQKYGEKVGKIFMMNLETMSESYSFSSKEIDLAIISLDSPLVKKIFHFDENLTYLGHVPITLADIADEPSGEASPVFIVGYPSSTSSISKIVSDPWRSNTISLPTFSFGRVAMLNKLLPYFKCDISAYPGDSGGPVIENGKLVGIVSQQPLIHTDIIDITNGNYSQTEKALTRIPFSIATKAKYIKELLEVQKKKDMKSEKNGF
jgi:hypothetical protein